MLKKYKYVYFGYKLIKGAVTYFSSSLKEVYGRA